MKWSVELFSVSLYANVCVGDGKLRFRVFSHCFLEIISDWIMKLVWMIDYCIICKPLIFVLIALYAITGSDITPVERISYISNISSVERRNNTVIALSLGICT